MMTNKMSYYRRYLQLLKRQYGSDFPIEDERLDVNDNVKVYQKIIQKYTTSTECCKGTKSLLYITYC